MERKMNGIGKYWYFLFIFFLLFPLVNYLVILGFTAHLLLGKVLLGLFALLIAGTYIDMVGKMFLEVIDSKMTEMKEILEKVKEILK